MHGRVTQADFRTGKSVTAFCREQKLCVAFLLVEETTAEKHCGEIRGSASGGVPGQRSGRRADRSPAAERPEPDGRARIDAEHVRALLAVVEAAG
jgi:hypothetical protein